MMRATAYNNPNRPGTHLPREIAPNRPSFLIHNPELETDLTCTKQTPDHISNRQFFAFLKLPDTLLPGPLRAPLASRKAVRATAKRRRACLRRQAAALQKKGPTLTRRAWSARKVQRSGGFSQDSGEASSRRAPKKETPGCARRGRSKQRPYESRSKDPTLRKERSLRQERSVQAGWGPARARQGASVSRRKHPAAETALGFLGGAEEDFADEALGGLGEEHGDGVGHVIGLEHFFCVLCGAMKKIRGDRAGANGGDADAVRAEIFGHAVGEAEQAPFGGAIGSAAGHGVFSGEGTDVDDVAAGAREHSGDDGAANEEHSFEIGV